MADNVTPMFGESPDVAEGQIMHALLRACWPMTNPKDTRNELTDKELTALRMAAKRLHEMGKSAYDVQQRSKIAGMVLGSSLSPMAIVQHWDDLTDERTTHGESKGIEVVESAEWVTWELDRMWHEQRQKDGPLIFMADKVTLEHPMDAARGMVAAERAWSQLEQSEFCHHPQVDLLFCMWVKPAGGKKFVARTVSASYGSSRPEPVRRVVSEPQPI